MGGVTLDSETNQNKTRLIYEDGNGSDTTTVIPKEGGKLSTGNHLSGLTPYHLLEGNISVTNTVQVNGFSSTTYTGTNASLTIDTGVDMNTQHGNDASERYGGLVIGKARTGTVGLYPTWLDTLRGGSSQLFSNSTSASFTPTAATTFNNNGVTLPTNNELNQVNNYVLWSFQTTHRRSTVSNHDMTVEEHYNPSTGFGMIKFVGSGLSGHEFTQSLGRKISFSIIKNITNTSDWRADSSLSSDRLFLNQASGSIGGNMVYNRDNSIMLPTNDITYNASGNTYIMYYWCNSYLDANKKLIGNYEIGTFIGNSNTNNRIYTKGKPCWIMIKKLDAIDGHWVIVDNSRGNNLLYLNTVGLDYSCTDVTFFKNGFRLNAYDTAAISSQYNKLNSKYIYLVVYDNDNNSGRSKYTKTTDTSTLMLNNAKIPFANGVDGNGSAKISTLLRNEVIPNLTFNTGKNSIYMKNDGTYGVNINKPNYNSFNGFGDYFDTVKNKWFKDVALLSDKCNNIGSWIGVNGTLTLSPSGNTLRITMTNTSYAPSASRQLTNLIVGKRYYVSAEKHTSSSVEGRIIVGSNPAGDEMLSTNTGVMSGTFIATATTGYVIIQCAGSAIGHYVEFNNVVCYPINIDGTLDTSNGVEITESRNYLDTIVYADHNGQVVYTEDVVKSKYERDLVITGSLSLTDVDNINSNKDIVYKINDVEKMRVREDGAILNQDGVAFSTGGFKNMLINGDFSIDQYLRGNQANFSNPKPYIDRWWVTNTLVTNNGQLIKAPKGFTNMLYVSKNNTHDTQIMQRVEIKKDTAVRTFNGRTFTFSFYVKSNVTNFIETLYFIKNGVTVNSYEVFNFKILNNTIAGEWVRVVGTITANFAYDAGDYIEIRIDPHDSVAGEVYITGCQLEEGSVATPYEFRHPSLEKVLCQRYFETTYNDGVAIGSPSFYGPLSWYGGHMRPMYYYKVPKRTIPTVTIYSPHNGTIGYFYNSSASAPISTIETSTGACRLNMSPNTALVDCSAHLVIDAEL